MLDTPEGDGAVVLFVEPGGPSDTLSIARGDLLVSVDGQEIVNHQRALALLHTRPGTKLKAVFKRAEDGSTRTVTIQPRKPRVTSLRSYLNPMISANANDGVLRYVRAQTVGPIEDRVNDLNKALEVDSRFVDAMVLRASLLFDTRPPEREGAINAVNEALAGWKAALDYEPENTIALTSRSTALTALNLPAKGRQDAAKALGIDDLLPRAYYALALAERQLKRPEKALGPARAAVELDPFNFLNWQLLANTFERLKRLDECKQTANGFAPFLEVNGFGDQAKSFRTSCTG
jgi:tetratricopeptide (TPR) repeat protein